MNTTENQPTVTKYIKLFEDWGQTDTHVELVPDTEPHLDTSTRETESENAATDSADQQ